MSDEKIDLVIGLEVLSGEHSSEGGYNNIIASNGQPYSYKFSGGNDFSGPNGELIPGSIVEGADKNNKASKIRVDLTQDSQSFSITGGGIYKRNKTINFSQGPMDISFSYVSGKLGNVEFFVSKSIVIHDADKHFLNADYVIYVYDHENNAHIPCDPSIRNRPSKVQ